MGESAWREKPPIDRAGARPYTPRLEPVAQPVEHVTFNHGVDGSNPSGLANIFNGLCFLP